MAGKLDHVVVDLGTGRGNKRGELCWVRRRGRGEDRSGDAYLDEERSGLLDNDDAPTKTRMEMKTGFGMRKGKRTGSSAALYALYSTQTRKCDITPTQPRPTPPYQPCNKSSSGSALSPLSISTPVTHSAMQDSPSQVEEGGTSLSPGAEILTIEEEVVDVATVQEEMKGLAIGAPAAPVFGDGVGIGGGAVGVMGREQRVGVHAERTWMGLRRG